MRILFLILGFIGLVSTLLKLFRNHHWTIRFFDFPQLQFLLLDTCAFLGILVFMDATDPLDWILSVALLASIIFEISIILPYTVLSKKQTPDAKNHDDSWKNSDISVMISNVYQLNKEYDRLIQVCCNTDPDILITLESNKAWEKELDQLENDYPHTVKIPLENMYGMHIYSRLKLSDTKIHYRVEKNIPSVESTVMLHNGMQIKIHCLHPKPPSPTENEESTQRDAELLLVARELQNFNGPVIVAGDLNDVAWSHSTRLFQRMSGLLDPRKGRGFFNTFSAKLKFFRWPLDHIFHSEHFELVDILRLPPVGSDHFPIYASFSFKSEPYVENEPEEPDREDEKEAMETINMAMDNGIKNELK